MIPQPGIKASLETHSNLFAEKTSQALHGGRLAFCSFFMLAHKNVLWRLCHVLDPLQNLSKCLCSIPCTEMARNRLSVVRLLEGFQFSLLS